MKKKRWSRHRFDGRRLSPTAGLIVKVLFLICSDKVRKLCFRNVLLSRACDSTLCLPISPEPPNISSLIMSWTCVWNVWLKKPQTTKLSIKPQSIGARSPRINSQSGAVIPRTAHRLANSIMK